MRKYDVSVILLLVLGLVVVTPGFSDKLKLVKATVVDAETNVADPTFKVYFYSGMVLFQKSNFNLGIATALNETWFSRDDYFFLTINNFTGRSFLMKKEECSIEQGKYQYTLGITGPEQLDTDNSIYSWIAPPGKKAFTVQPGEEIAFVLPFLFSGPEGRRELVEVTFSRSRY